MLAPSTRGLLCERGMTAADSPPARTLRGLCFRRVGRAVATLAKWIKFDYHCSAYFARLQRVVMRLGDPRRAGQRAKLVRGRPYKADA